MAISLVIKNQCIPRKNKTKFVLLVTNQQNFVKKLWAHDVHAMKLPCASCHTLHPKDDAMKGIQPKNRVKLCVDCHGEQQKRKAAKDAQSQTQSTEQRINNDSLFTPKLCFRHGGINPYDGDISYLFSERGKGG